MVFFIFLTFAFILHSSRYIFFYRYEPDYYESYYYHSQWNYPNSTRGISDGELYKFVGFRLAEGENPFNINFETPPLGKYLYGLAEKYIRNPYWVSILLFIFSVYFLYLLTMELFGKKRLSLLSCLLFITTPFVSSQIKETMLDLPLLFFYLGHIFFFVKLLNKSEKKYLILSGIFLGLATGTKVGVYTPFVILVESVIFFTKNKKGKATDYFLYLGSIFTGYVFAFFCYFIKHPNPIPWIILHQKQLKFYLEPFLKYGNSDHFLVWKSIFLNAHQGWWKANEGTIGGGSLILPLGVVFLLPALYLSIKKKNYTMIYVLLMFVMFLFVDHFTFTLRYLMPTVPLFILTLIFIFRKKSLVLLVICLLNLPFLFSFFSANYPAGDMEAVARFFSTRAYQELYRSITPSERQDIPEKQFIDFNENFLETLGVRAIEAKFIGFSKTAKTAQADYQVEYETKYGKLNHVSQITFLKQNNQWRQVWTGDLLWPGYRSSSKISVKEETIALKKIENKNNEVLAVRGKWKMVYMFPRVMFNWNQNLKDLSEVTGENMQEIDSRIRGVVPDHFVRFVGYLDPALGSEGAAEVDLISGAKLKDVDYLIIKAGNREEAANIIRSLQRDRPELFYMQAIVSFTNENNQEVTLPFQSTEENDVVVKL